VVQDQAGGRRLRGVRAKLRILRSCKELKPCLHE
jgi:hypothetical protein